VAAIAQRLGLPEIVARLLAIRGLDTETARDFLDPSLRALMPDPSCLTDMDAAADRLAAAIRCGETVGVFGDYDVDGACSAAVMTLFLRGLGCIVFTHVPDRMTEGYGPNAPALAGLAAQGASLLVCVDCGTASRDVLATLHNVADVIVLDHHAAQGALPDVVAMVNPNRPDCLSGLRSLCAAGVAFMAVVATQRALRRTGHFATVPEPDLKELLDLVALATVCDVMPLTGLNRAFVTRGLQVLGRRGRPGLAALLEVAKVVEAPSAMSLGWALGPRINAAGRISEADLGLRLLLAQDDIQARSLAATLDSVNRTRQMVEAEMLDAAMAQAEAQLAAGHSVVLVAGSQWHPGVVGIVAGRIKERFNRPACVAALADGMAKGSGRSVAGIDLGAAIIAARAHGLLSSGGGHAMAAGFGLPEPGLATFHAFLDERLAAAALLPSAAELVIEGGLAVPGCTLELARDIARLAPFGPGNAEPVLVLASVRVAHAERIGKEGATIRAQLEGEAGGRVKALLFRAEGRLAETLLGRPDARLDMAGHLRAETWNGRESVSFMIRDATMTQPA
jgi:single-stranded-DNA-specific exonuclease